MWDVRVIYTASCGMLMLPLNVSSQWASLDWRQYFFFLILLSTYSYGTDKLVVRLSFNSQILGKAVMWWI